MHGQEISAFRLHRGRESTLIVIDSKERERPQARWQVVRRVVVADANGSLERYFEPTILLVLTVFRASNLEEVLAGEGALKRVDKVTGFGRHCCLAVG